MPLRERSTSHGGAFQPGEDYNIDGDWHFLTLPSLRGVGPYAVPDPFATVSQIGSVAAASVAVALANWGGSTNLVTVGTLANLTVTNPIVGSLTAGTPPWVVDGRSGQTFNSVFDPMLLLGSNISVGGVRPNLSDAAIWVQLEHHWFDGVNHFSEINFNTVSTGGVTRRAYGLTVDRTNPDAYTRQTFWIDPVGGRFRIWDVSDPTLADATKLYHDFQPGQYVVSGSATPIIKWLATSGATPGKSIRVSGGHLQVVNSAFSAVILDLSDEGVLTQGGALALGTTSTDGIVVQNTTLATAGIPVQQSPRVRFRANVWNTTTPANNTDDWFLQAQPTSGAAPVGAFQIQNILNGVASVPLILTSAGNLTITGNFSTVASYILSNNSAIRWGAGAGTRITSVSINGTLNLSTADQANGVGLDVVTDAVLKIRTRAHTGYATVDALGYRASGAAGATFGPAAVTSITVVGGIVTAIS